MQSLSKQFEAWGFSKKGSRRKSSMRKRPSKQRGNPPRRLGFESVERRLLLATVTVSNTSDVVNAVDTSSVAALVNNQGGDGISLREAVLATNADSGNDRIEFAPGLAGKSITLAGTELEITDSLEIISPDNRVTISGNNASRVLGFTAPTGNLNLLNLIIRDGRSAVGGGAIRFESSGGLTLSKSQVSNSVSTGSGGGIYVDEGSLNMKETVISANSGGDGGGVYSSSGNVSMIRSTLDGNVASGNSSGGGLYSESGTVNVSSSTVSRNEAFQGGGMFVSTANLFVVDSTISGNGIMGPQSTGAGVYAGAGSTLVFSSSTITENQGATPNSKFRGSVGGVFADGEVTINNSIVAGNNVVNSPDLKLGDNASASIAYSLIGTNQGTSLPQSQMPDADGNLIGGSGTSAIDPKLTVLGNFGGVTETHAPLAGSPVINAGLNTTRSVDQRGAPRIVDGQIDIGSVEGTPHGFFATDNTLFIIGRQGRDWLSFFQTSQGVLALLSGEAPYASSTPATRLVVYAQGGNDRALLYAHEDLSIEIYAGSGNDLVLVQNGGSTTIHGEEGNDRIWTGSGADTVFAGAGKDQVVGGRGNDLLRGGAGEDDLRGGPGNDILIGDEGDDVLQGGGGRDLLIGGLGRDQLDGDGNDNILVGGNHLQESNSANLNQIIALWAADLSVQDRINSIQGSPATLFLLFPDIVVRPRSVFDDGEVDTLNVNANDWVFQQAGDAVNGSTDFLNSDWVF